MKLALMLFAFIILLLWVLVFVARADTISELVPIIIQAESSGNPNASDGHSYGLMGISPCVLEDFNRDGYKIERGWKDKRMPTYNIGDLFNPTINVTIGSWYLYEIREWLPDEYKNSKAHLVAAYNMGFFSLKKRNFVIPRHHKNKIYNSIYQEYWNTP